MAWLAHVHTFLAHVLRSGTAHVPCEMVPCPCGAHGGVPDGASPGSWTSLRVRSRLPLPLIRLLGAECPLCDGLGCQHCAHTGLR
jgi:hypothetical protein